MFPILSLRVSRAAGNRWLILAAAVAGALVLTAADRASASVSCGEVITQNTRLQSDLDCPGDGIVIGADGITLNLNGHTVSTSCPDLTGCPGRVGIDNSAGYDRVRLLNGVVFGFEQGIMLVGAGKNTLARLRVDVGGYGRTGSNAIVLSRSNENLIKDSFFSTGDPAVLLSASDRNTISGDSISGGIDIRVGDGLVLRDGSDSNTVAHVTVDASNAAMFVGHSRGNRIAWNDIGAYGGALYMSDVQRTVVVHNTLSGGQGCALCASGDDSTIRHNTADGIVVDGDRNSIAYNESKAGYIGSPPPISIHGGDRNLVRRNSASESYGSAVIEIGAAATKTSVVANLAIGGQSGGVAGSGDGIEVEAPGTLIRGNTATNNEGLGIDAVTGVIDGGGNHASGNGDPLQCVNVLCSP